MASEKSKLPRNFTETEMMRMMFGEDFLLSSNNNFEESNEESDIFKDIFFKNGIEPISQTGFEIISGSISIIQESNSEENNKLNSQNDIMEPHPLEFETLGFTVEDPFVSHNGNFDRDIISQNGTFDHDIISQNGNFEDNIISPNGNFDLPNGNLNENHHIYMGPSEVDLYATIGGNLGTSSDNFIETDPLEFDHEITLPNESTDEEPEPETELVYGNMGAENDSNILSTPINYDSHIDTETQDNSYAFSEEANKDSANRTEPKSLSKDLSDQLRVQASRVLTEAGWQIDPRKRSDRTKMAAYYKFPPSDLIFTTFSKAWRTCGQILAAHSSSSNSSEIKEWSDVSIFWVDLAETVSRLSGSVSIGQSLRDKWRILDPYVSVVCIDKKVHVLRNRGTLRVVNGESMVVSEGRRKREKVGVDEIIIINNNNNDENDGVEEGRKSNKGRRVKRKKCSCGDKDCGNDYINLGGLVECKYYNNHDDDPKISNDDERINDSANMDDNNNIDYETKLVNNSIKKSRKRSKRISEIDAPGGANGENSDMKPPKKPRSSETKPKARRWPKSEASENGFSDIHFAGNRFLENDLIENNSLNESSLPKSAPDSLAVSTNTSNPIEEIDNINANGNDIEPPKRTKRGRKPKNPPGTKKQKNGGYKRPRGFHIYDDDLLITAIIKNKDFNSSGKFASASTLNPKKKYKMRTLRKTPKRKFQLALRNKTNNKSKKKNPNSNPPLDSRRLILARKTVLSWLIATGGIALNEIIQYRNLKNSEVLKEGWVTLEGILCNCCSKIMSLTEFKNHAGPRCQRNGNIFLQSGKSFTLCQLEAWSAEYRLRKGVERVNGSGSGSDKDDQNDDTCALCGDGGELLCCDKCPNTYHPACLPCQEAVPEGSWYCWHCICQSCGNAVGGKNDISTSCDLKCLQCEDSYHDTCIGGITSDGDDTWFCGISCQEIHQWLRSHVGVANFFDDGLSWTILRSNHEEQKVHSTQKIALMAECNTKLAVALTLMEECFVPMVDPRTGIDMIPHVVYNRGSNFARLDYKGFYTVVLEKGDDIVSVASLRIHGNRIAEMPLVATNMEYRRQGMCRRLLDTIERMLRSFRVKLLVLSAIPDLVETWVTGFGFKPIQENEKKLLNNITLMLFPGSSILTKNLVETDTQKSECKKDADEREDEMITTEENNYPNFEDLIKNSDTKLDQSENGNLDIRATGPESTVDCQVAKPDHSQTDGFL